MPDRIVGEVRQEERLDLLISSNSGLPGMCSIRANSARESIVKLCTLPLLAGESVGHGFAQPSQHVQPRAPDGFWVLLGYCRDVRTARTLKDPSLSS